MAHINLQPMPRAAYCTTGGVRGAAAGDAGEKKAEVPSACFVV